MYLLLLSMFRKFKGLMVGQGNPTTNNYDSHVFF